MWILHQPSPLPLGGCGGWDRLGLRHRVLRQHRLEPLQQPAFVAVAQGELTVAALDQQPEDVSHVLGPLRWLVQTHTD